jgi:hypothetical protein
MKRALAADAALIVAAFAAATVRLPPAFVEAVYANGLYAHLNAALVPLANAFPLAVGDFEAAFVAGLAIRTAVRAVRARNVLPALAHAAGLAAAIVLAFNLLWGWNYRRAPVVARVDFDAARIDARSVGAFGDRIAAILNGDVQAAHARANAESAATMRAELARAFLPVVARLGDTWPVAVTVPKTTVADRLYEAAGVGGQYDPFAFETLLAAALLPFEVPRALAHEWAHAAGFGDEGDANVIGTIACLRSSDPLIRYSAAYWTYGELPADVRARLRLAPAVVADFTAGRERYLRYYDPNLFRLSWNVYDRYLRTNGVAGGVASYGHDLRLLVGTAFDPDGLPRPARAR